MNVKTDQTGGVSIVRVGETRLMYPILGDFSAAVSALVNAGKRDILIDQMNDRERREYLAESLFLNTVKYENDKLEAYMKKLVNRK